MSNNKPQTQQSPEQYLAQLKQTVYSLAGELTSQMGTTIDQLGQQLNNLTGRAAYFAQENQRLMELLRTNNISSAIPNDPKKSKIAPPPVPTINPKKKNITSRK